MTSNNDVIHFAPKSDEKKQEWLQIFQEYKMTGCTMAALANKYDISKSHMSKIIKWGMDLAMKNNDEGVFKNVMLARLEKNVNTLDTITTKLLAEVKDMGGQELIHSPNAVKNIKVIMEEARKTHESVGNLMGVMNAAENTAAPKIEINVPNIGRGTGAPEIKEVN